MEHEVRIQMNCRIRLLNIKYFVLLDVKYNVTSPQIAPSRLASIIRSDILFN